MINNVVLVGRLTKDPDLRYTSSGSAVATFTLAVNRNFTNASGNREADFINCVIWRKPAETLANYARKGTLLGVVGRIQTRSYDNPQGQRVYVTEVVVDNFQLLESRSQNEQRGVEGTSQGFSQTQQQNTPESFQQAHGAQGMLPGTEVPKFSGSDIDISDDDLPF
ncbi:single-stranded DNA-binding protein [Candidatus Enterococcus clewellii]|uniref:Single-stranded DNA-binding protein n=1 Tax=Candidatus Enterococcus clewellii TaxID=1834193 RepID=A0A242K451_9ENTE|nr:single-stranded DNA-binding protein [Enterococcus sp. 9E7_DIV0242]OTP13693.1 single-strand binding protein [Enterococcus sp. 9E7_DIV0242]